jgi:4-methylaminobutanoate oxidase (formaldehyde-forming)
MAEGYGYAGDAMTAPEHLADRDLDVTSALPAAPLPSAARIAIVGGGIVGASIAYHLALAGESDVVLLERGRLTNGTTWHAAGLVSQVRGTHALTELSRINVETYERVARETGIDPGFRRVGSLTVARSEERFREIRGPVSIARDADLPSEIVDPERIRELWPAAAVDDLVGGVLFPDDGTINPGSAALALARAAVDRGIRYVPGTTIAGFRRGTGGRRVTGITTTAGDVDAEVVVLAAGLWTSELARLADASVALYPAEHVWVMTDETPAATENLPFLRDLDGYLYIRHHGGRFVIGAFEPSGKPWAPSGVPTDGYVALGPDWDHFGPVLTAARSRVPALVDLGFAHFLRAPESFTPDANLQLGFVPEVPGLFVAAGLNSQGIIFGPGVGKAAAEWILAGRMTMDLVEVDVARMGRWASQRRWLHERTVETLGGLYAMHWPGKQPETARGLRRLPLDTAYRAAGAAMGQVGGWERPLWFEPRAGPDGPEVRFSYTDPSWFPAVHDEVRATREGVALYDLSTYAKFEVTGPGALAGLQQLVTSDLEVPVGRIVYTILSDDHGGILIDPTITRLGADRFLVLAPTVTQRRTEGLLRAGLPSGSSGHAVVTDVTSGWATLHVAGPRSRELMTRLTDADVSAAAWPFLEGREIEVARVQALALRVSFTGELGWELLVPTEFVADLREHIVRVGADIALRDAGTFAFEACRLERGFRSWGHDVGPLDDPFAAGLGFTVSRRKAADFVGRAALERLRDVPDRERPRRLVSLHAPSAVLWHGESVRRGTQRVGHVTSASIAPTLGGSVALAWVDGQLDDGDWCVEIGGDLSPCVVSAEPFYDPSGERLRG